MPNVQVAKDWIRLLGKVKVITRLLFLRTSKTVSLMIFLRYTIDSSKLHDLGWKETTSWEEGLAKTVEWYKQYSSRYGNIEHVLVAHPRVGMESSNKHDV